MKKFIGNICISESAANAAAAAAAENEEKPRERLSSSVQGKDRSESPFSRSQQTISEREKEREITNEKQWNYSGLDIMNSGNFWQNYSGNVFFYLFTSPSPFPSLSRALTHSHAQQRVLVGSDKKHPTDLITHKFL